MIGIVCKWECPSCGNVLKTASPFWDDKTRKNVVPPKRCGCKRTTGFKLLDFSRCTYAVLPKGTKIVDQEGNTLVDNTDEEEPEKAQETEKKEE